MSEFESCFSEYDQEVFGSGDGQDYLGGGDGLILPPLVVGDKSQTIPEPPVDFVHGIIPAVEGSLLKNMHLHIRDNALTFEPVAHKYFINGVPTIGSVTGLLHDFVNEFNADTAIQMMRRSRNWPRAEYLQDGLPMTDEQIKSKWEHNRVDAANQGTYMHLTFELYLNRWTISNYSVEMNIFLKYLSTLDGLTAYRTEWMIYGEDLNLAGSIDFVATRSDGALVLFDWKRTKELHTKYSNRFQSMTGPLSHLADCAGMHYRLQLNVYRYILEKYYGQKVHSMFVVGCHPAYASSQAFVDEVPILEDETTILIRHQFSKTISDEYLDYLGAGDEDPEFDFERQLAEEMAYNNETPIAVAPVRLSQAKEEQAEPETVAVLNQVFGLDNLELTVKTEEADAVAEDAELPQGLQREDSELLKAVDTLLLEDESEVTFIHKCTDAALFNLGDDRLKPSRGHFDDDAGSGPPSSWPIWIAQALRKGRLLTYFIEWCDTPVSKKAGVCYADACILYDVSDSLLVHHVEPSPNNDIYVYIPTPLLDPVLESMVARLPQFLSQTFWCNFEHYASEVKTLTDALLARAQQIEEFADSFILTGQEAPNGTRQLREDLFKKTMSADGIPGRKPYGLQTRMLELIGWKRLELNKMLRFGSVTETNFNSILRRCFVWKPKARFWDRDYLKHNYPDSHLDGIFPKCAELRTFLVSPAAIAASLRIQYGFEQKHSKELCRQMIENYVVLGGDEGMTEERMRFACGLKPRDKRQQTVSGPPDAFASGSQADRDEDTTALFKVHDFLVEQLLSESKSYFTFPYDWKKIQLPRDSPNVDKPTLLQLLASNNLLRKTLDEICHRSPIIQDGSYPESFDIASIKSYVDGNPTRESNALVVIDFFDSVIKALKPRKGRPSAAMTQRLEEVNKMVAKLRKSEELCKQLLHMVQDPADGGVSAKRRRLTRKHSEEEPKKEFHAQHTNYKYVGLPTTRGRRYVVGTGAQSLSRRLQRVAFPHTMDLDQVNSVFVILDQLLDKLEISTVIPNDIRKVISDCAHRREQVCRVDLQTDISTGKQLLHSVLHGGLLKTLHESNVFLQKLQKASIYLRWLACSIMPDAYEFYCNQPDKKFPECTVLQHLCTIVEDHIMEALTDFIRYHPVQHLSLHFDGIRLNVDYRLNVDEPQDVEILMRLAETHIAEATGFLAQFKVKRHQYLSELITEHTVSKTKVDVPHIFLKRGNCIPLALAHITGEYQHIQTGLGDTDNRDNMYAASRFSRTYRQALTLTQCKLVPHTGFAIDADGVYLLHTDGDGSPHRIGVTVKDAKSSVIIWDGEEQFALPWSEFNLIVNRAIDASSFITFRVFFSADACIWPTDIDKADLETLLELQAGGKKASSTLKRPASANLQTVCKKVAKPVLRRPAAGCDGADSESECNSEPSVDLEPLDVTDPADEAIVVVGDKLLALLKSEVAATKRLTKFSPVDRCPLCPFRRFPHRFAGASDAKLQIFYLSMANLGQSAKKDTASAYSAGDSVKRVLSVKAPYTPQYNISSFGTLALDPVHLPIVYEYSTWRKRTPGSIFLRTIMAKFNKRDNTRIASSWGPFYCGDSTDKLDKAESIMRQKIDVFNQSDYNPECIERKAWQRLSLCILLKSLGNCKGEATHAETACL
ncbi:unnamed protein product [Polarella glacialis]|uniref:Uncharacterized protein n=1 Tax=Polarella glacialis TaxID=89957 RepID=A0A813LLJ9_POLGL|nr:unnamed protein product [Polarella glacialis]